MPLIKHREIGFCQLHPDHQQAQNAALLLSDLDGVLDVTPLEDGLHLQISYSLRETSLLQIETLLEKQGYHLDNTLLANLRRSLYHYSEETEIHNRYLDEEKNSTQNVFIRRYHQSEHGCRDNRPGYWRRYL
ncbi:MAG: hypothetical protein Q9O24_13685 [Gammaproteobacteria bacterium]|nr:hypothetical protein [Gammaproteobacteria bacterium]